MPNPKKTTNYETMHNIEIAEQAILHKIKMSFNYLHFNDDLKLVNKDDDIRIIEPRYIVYADARPYLLATGRKNQRTWHKSCKRLFFDRIHSKRSQSSVIITGIDAIHISSCPAETCLPFFEMTLMHA